MKNTQKKIFFLTLGLILFACCSESQYRKYFDFKNNSNKLIYWGASYSYPDTSLKSINNIPGVVGTAYKIYPQKIEAFSLGNFNYNPTMQVFIFDADVIEKTPWDTIVKYDMFLKRYQFTKGELENMNWEIVYDGN